MGKRVQAEFAKADRAVDKTAAAIVARINKLLDRPTEVVAHDYLIERLLLVMADDLAAIIDTMAMPGSATVTLSNALLDYRDSLAKHR